ncbi:MAG: AbrB family transcriptional regulator [Coriobacteriaceae bacterium]|nr:AbrB family transcriptional regulator [Coriobacteriaceae bacterium]
MKDTGIVRRVDDLGRIVIPMELRKTLGIGVRDPLAVFVDGERIVLQKYAQACIICGSTQDVGDVRGKPVCTGCVKAIKTGK